MSFQDTLNQDVSRIFLAGGGNDFSVPVQYTPFGGQARNINGICGDAIEDYFHDGNLAMKWIKRTLEISSDNNVAGVVAPKVYSRDGGGDSCVINGKTWYVVDQLVDGAAAATGFHTLILGDKPLAGTRKH